MCVVSPRSSLEDNPEFDQLALLAIKVGLPGLGLIDPPVEPAQIGGGTRQKQSVPPEDLIQPTHLRSCIKLTSNASPSARAAASARTQQIYAPPSDPPQGSLSAQDSDPFMSPSTSEQHILPSHDPLPVTTPPLGPPSLSPVPPACPFLSQAYAPQLLQPGAPYSPVYHIHPMFYHLGPSEHCGYGYTRGFCMGIATGTGTGTGTRICTRTCTHTRPV
jgi:hypothetical protein